MKKYFALAAIVAIVTIFSNCHSAKKAQAEIMVPKLTYEHDLQAVISQNCSPCHIPAKGGNKKPFDTYEGAKANIDSMISRIVRNPGEKGFMPWGRGKQKLSDSTINLFKQWRDDGAMK
jgi:hypothetical protein